MRDRWTLWKQLKSKATGLGWDHLKGTIGATDEWWTLRIEENPKLEQFRKEGIEPELECKFEQIFGSYANGNLKYTPVSSMPQQTLQDGVCDMPVLSPPNTHTPRVSVDETHENYYKDNNSTRNESWNDMWRDLSPSPTSSHVAPHDDTYIERDITKKGKRVLEGDSSQNTKNAKAKKSAASTFQEMFSGMMQQFEMRNKVVEEVATSVKNMTNANMSVLNSMDAHTSKYSIEDVMAKLCCLPDLDPLAPEFLFACSLLEDPQKRTILFNLPHDESRVAYIRFMYIEHKKSVTI
ncbi:unnamed protein product [Cuscuta europaea]|uniref:Myb/SANT-like domain-containing protein n=1 Tax=Cuscuta europaea TaxID=41803 RepID=A0A9P0YXM2_CUSEU|nr:unnamed protein product [Cuscuta europaea]